jgi:phage tail protein X
MKKWICTAAIAAACFVISKEGSLLRRGLTITVIKRAATPAAVTPVLLPASR